MAVFKIRIYEKAESCRPEDFTKIYPGKVIAYNYDTESGWSVYGMLTQNSE